MKKLLTALLSVCMLFCTCFMFACNDDEEKAETPNNNQSGWGTVYTIETAYAKAQGLGYEGSLEEFLESIKGKDGSTGKDGIGISSITKNQNGELIINLTQGKPINLGKIQGSQGEKGENGEDGNGIVSIKKISSEGNVDTYEITFTDGTSNTFTITNGQDGKDGQDGEDGKNGADGKDGKDGVDGEDGKNGADGKDGKDGVDGEDGKNGADGKDGVSITDTTLNDKGELIITLSKGDPINLGVVVEHAHSLAYIPAKAETCDTDGNIEYWRCITCNKKYVVAEEVTEVTDIVIKAGHEFTNYVSNSAANCEDDATEIAACNRAGCNQTDIRTVGNSALGHNYADGVCLVCGEFQSKGIEFTLITDSEYSVSIGTCTQEKIVIPSQYNNLPVTTIKEDGFRGALTVKEVTLPDSVTKIEDSAFSGCKNLEKINLEKVTTIGNTAFKDAFSDSSIQITYTFPKVTLTSLQSLGNSAFNGCKKLREVDMTGAPLDNIPAGAFASCDSLYTVQLSQNTKTVHKNGFNGDITLTHINLDYVEYFKSSCFEGCSSIKNPVLTNCVDIRDRAFFDCELVKVTIGDRAERIYVEAFQSVLDTFTVGNAGDFVSYYSENYYAVDEDTGLPTTGSFGDGFPKFAELVSEDNPQGRADKNNPKHWIILMSEYQNQGSFVCTQKWLDDNGYVIGQTVNYGVIFNQP